MGSTIGEFGPRDPFKKVAWEAISLPDYGWGMYNLAAVAGATERVTRRAARRRPVVAGHRFAQNCLEPAR